MHPFGDAPKSASSAYRPFLHDRYFNAATSFQIGVVRAPPSANQIRGWPKFRKRELDPAGLFLDGL